VDAVGGTSDAEHPYDYDRHQVGLRMIFSF